MKFIVICALIFTSTTLAILYFALEGSFYNIMKKIFKTIKEDRDYQIYFALFILFCFLNMIEAHLDSAVSSFLGYDMTNMVKSDHYHLSLLLQKKLLSPFILYYFSWVYVFAFSCLLLTAFLVFTHHKNLTAVRMLTWGYILNFLFALPFNVFLVIKEPWMIKTDHVFLMLDKIDPRLIKICREFSGNSDCFPSLHTSLSFTVMFVSFINKENKFGLLSAILAVSIALSTLFLGIHWPLDVLGGILLALFVLILLSASSFKKELGSTGNN